MVASRKETEFGVGRLEYESELRRLVSTLERAGEQARALISPTQRHELACLCKMCSGGRDSSLRTALRLVELTTYLHKTCVALKSEVLA